NLESRPIASDHKRNLGMSDVKLGQGPRGGGSPSRRRWRGRQLLPVLGPDRSVDVVVGSGNMMGRPWPQHAGRDCQRGPTATALPPRTRCSMEGLVGRFKWSI